MHIVTAITTIASRSDYKMESDLGGTELREQMKALSLGRRKEASY